MRSSKIFLSIFVLLFIATGSASNVTVGNLSNQTIQINQSDSINNVSQSGNVSTVTIISSDGVRNANTSSSDQQFLFLMNQYWIPDLYDIKGRIDGAAGFGVDVPQMLNLSADYARIRLSRNINETNEYAVSPPIDGLKAQYQAGAIRSIHIIDGIMTQNRSEETFAEGVPMRTAALSLYGSWLEYQVMRCYNLPNLTYPEIAAVPPDQFMQVMGAITT
ncbi:MAG: hypothetical protein CVV33_01845 [Methanomicrobiales archaeon HGW-Methanomicrobiales-4]|nr:MAG: hypothetical protein CVV33_01845 [Methanomicrobiales archaeon HGW-Methanomicrobiales-4]